jgi:hypothetical protein
VTFGNKKHTAEKSKATRAFGEEPAAAVDFRSLPDVVDGAKKTAFKNKPPAAPEKAAGGNCSTPGPDAQA